MRKLAILLCAVLIFCQACASGEGPVDAAESAHAEHVFYAEPDAVVEAAKLAFGDFDFTVIETKKTGSDAWSIIVKKNPTNTMDEEIDRLVVKRNGPKETGVYLIMQRSFFDRFSGRPGWADNFFTNIFERMP